MPSVQLLTCTCTRLVAVVGGAARCECGARWRVKVERER